MKVLLIRHAIAEALTDFPLGIQSDELRPLTPKGKMKMKKGVDGLRQLVPHIDRLVSSPLRRAVETADIIANNYPEVQRETLPDLAPQGSVTGVLTYLQEFKDITIVLVGHEPHLGELATWLLSGQRETWLPLKKGSACLLKFPDTVATGQADLHWLLTPKLLRMLA